LDRRLDGPQRLSGGGGEEKNPCPYWELKQLVIQPLA